MKRFRWLKILIAFLIPLAFTMVSTNSLDNDAWYVLSEGREIVENGLYFEDQLSMHESLAVIVQNYGYAAIFYLIYSAFGPLGIYIGMLVLELVLMFLIYKVCMLLSNKNENLSLILMVLTTVFLGNGYIVTRAQVVSYILLLLVIYLMELHIRKGKEKVLWWIPLVSLVQINLHASLWPMIPVVMAVYVIDSIKQPRLHYNGYKALPIIVTGIISVLVGFINPYGLRMITFIFTSYGVPEANAYINELSAFRLSSPYYILLYTSVVIVLFLYIFAKNKNIRLRYLLMLFGFLALGLNTVKGMSHLILVLFFPLADVYKDVKIGNKKNRRIFWMAGSWLGILAVLSIIVVIFDRFPNMKNGPRDEMITVMDFLDEETKGQDKKSLKIYSNYNEGGYVEFRGYRPYMDPRMEVFIKANNGKEDIFQEYYQLENGQIEENEFLEKYDFDYILGFEGSGLYDIHSKEYALIYEEDGEGDYDGVRVYKKANV
ncbi:hypothetical protein IJ076_03365 [Candidatus Saccharibacteria bacterium]|nr:hypothetical protein [Candidatus Saccharibacteria bacterium]